MAPHLPKPTAGSDPQYPLGRFEPPPQITPTMLEDALLTIGELPQNLRGEVEDLTDGQLCTPYRDGGWTVQQLVNHIADSHMHAYIRCKLALTEDQPTIKTYDENLWANLHDGMDGPVEWSMQLVESLHARWLMLLRSLGPEQWKRAFVHPDLGTMCLDTVVLMYAWHSRHHVAQIQRLRSAEGW